MSTSNRTMENADPQTEFSLFTEGIAYVTGKGLKGGSKWAIASEEDKVHLGVLVAESFAELAKAENNPGFLSYWALDKETGMTYLGLNAQGVEYFNTFIYGLTHESRKNTERLGNIDGQFQRNGKGARIIPQSSHGASLLVQNSNMETSAYDPFATTDAEIVGSRETPLKGNAGDTYSAVKRSMYGKLEPLPKVDFDALMAPIPKERLD